MKKFYLSILTVFVFTTFLFSQSNENTADLKWVYFKISEKNLKIRFPKLPVRLNYIDLCKQTVADTFYAYADEVVYEMKIYEKAKERIPERCTEKKKFDESNFENYLSVMQARPDFESIKLQEKGSLKFFKFEKEYDSYKYAVWLLNDYKNFRWFEFTISTYKEKAFDENQFIESLKFEIDQPAIEINNGSTVLLGDNNLEKETSVEKNNLNDKSDNSKSSALNIILKPKPKYTDVARQTNTVGSVRMRVTFLPNGAVGAVTPLTTLEHGLTEQAIEAARKMAFLPQRRNNTKIAVTKIVVYTFTIY